VSLPLPQLDDRDFQSLVDEARMRIAHTCPAWNEHNVSDPGITLIELFAWMTDMLVYRVNRLPEKAQIALLDLIGVQLAPVKVASTDLRFRLSAPATVPLPIDVGTEVASGHPSAGGPVVFTTVEPIVVPPLRLAAMLLIRGGMVSEVSVRDGVAQPVSTQQSGLSSPQRPDDALYFGFHDSPSRLVVEVAVESEPGRGTGIAPDAPPWSWELAGGDGAWQAATVLSDGTGGFNYGTGVVELQLPRAEGAVTVAGRQLHWLRCRLLGGSDVDGRGYTRAPSLKRVSVAAVGALVHAENASRVAATGTLVRGERTSGTAGTGALAASPLAASALGSGAAATAAPTHEQGASATVGEILGYSDGSPGQTFRLRRQPALSIGRNDGLDVLEPVSGSWVPWSLQSSFADSGAQDRHYCFDAVAGEVSLGPAIRETDSWVQRGAIPPEGAALRMRYRWGGGAKGNVDAGTLIVLRHSIVGIASVTNPDPAKDGVDAESLTDALRRAPIELRARSRAVTATDHEVLARQASRLVARARCVVPLPGQPAQVRILPVVSRATERIEPAELLPSEELLETVAGHLDEYRLLGAHVEVMPAALRGVTVVTEVQTDPGAEPAEIEHLIEAALYRYINPYVGGSLAGEGEGWEYGRALTVGEVEVVVRGVPGVREVTILRLYATDLASGRPDGQPVRGQLEIGVDELLASGEHLARALEPQAP
jgi:predicted phage baseplate assembly protein